MLTDYQEVGRVPQAETPPSQRGRMSGEHILALTEFVCACWDRRTHKSELKTDFNHQPESSHEPASPILVNHCKFTQLCRTAQ